MSRPSVPESQVSPSCSSSGPVTKPDVFTTRVAQLKVGRPSVSVHVPTSSTHLYDQTRVPGPSPGHEVVGVVCPSLTVFFSP